MLPDPIERMESYADTWFHENVNGDEFLCCCGKTAKLSEADYVDPNPYASPVCGDCFEEWFEEMEKKHGKSEVLGE